MSGVSSLSPDVCLSDLSFSSGNRRWVAGDDRRGHPVPWDHRPHARPRHRHRSRRDAGLARGWPRRVPGESGLLALARVWRSRPRSACAAGGACSSRWWRFSMSAIFETISFAW